MSKKISWRALLCITLLGIWIAGCRRTEPTPDIAPQGVPAEIVQKIQDWYNPKTAHLRSQKNGMNEVYLPQWGAGKLVVLPTGERVAFFPAHRNKAVEYHALGFVRRFAVKLSPDNTVVGVKMVELIGERGYLGRHKDEAMRRHLLGTAKGMPIIVMESTLPLDGMRNKTGPNCEIRTVELATGVIRVFNTCGGYTDYPLTGDEGGTDWWHDPNTSGDAGKYTGGTWNGGSTPPQEYFGGAGSSSSGGGTIGGGTGSTPIIPIFQFCSGVGLTSSPCPPTDTGDNTPPTSELLPGDLPAEMHPYFRNLLAGNTIHHLTTYGQLMSLNEAFKRSYDKSCITRAAIKHIKDSGLPVVLNTKTDMGEIEVNGLKYVLGGQMQRTQIVVGGVAKDAIGVRISSRNFFCYTCNDEIHGYLNSFLFEELFHGLQSTVYTTEFSTMSQTNKEFEVKFLIDLANFLQKGTAFGMVFQAFDGKSNEAYKAWLEEITEMKTKVPSHDKIMEKYNQMRELFRSQYAPTHPYGGQPSVHEPLMMKKVLDSVRATPDCK